MLCTPQTNVILYFNYISMKEKGNVVYIHTNTGILFSFKKRNEIIQTNTVQSHVYVKSRNKHNSDSENRLLIPRTKVQGG